jgi:hypothetical protein
MAGFSALGLGLLLGLGAAGTGGAMALGKARPRAGSSESDLDTPGPSGLSPRDLQRLGSRPRQGRPIIGQAVPRGSVSSMGSPNPSDTAPDVGAEESANVSGASAAAVRTRRRASAGNAGRVGGAFLGYPSPSAPRTLLGY